MLAQAIGRWGNFANGEAFGYEVAESSPLYFMRMGIVSEYTGIYNFSSDNGFDDVFHGNNSQETAVFILYLCDVFLFQKHFFPDFAH